MIELGPAWLYVAAVVYGLAGAMLAVLIDVGLAKRRGGEGVSER